MSTGGVLGLAAIPPLALAVGLPGAFLVTGLAGMAWAVWGGLTILPSHTSSSSTAATATTKKSDQQQQEQQEQQQKQPQQKGSGGLQRLLQLPRSTLVQLGVLCYSHAVMGYCFFILQVIGSVCLLVVVE